MEYSGMDVFANPNVLEKDWSQGWYIDIHYADLSNTYKRAWAFAMYSDLSGSTGIGGDWKENVASPLGTPYGGRKTNVWATTDPIKVLYDGPRRFVAQTRTTLYGASTHVIADGLVNVTLTFEYNKDKKEIIVFKDIKRLDQGKFGRNFQVEFSNRGEWDIGTTSAPPSYAYFYDNLPTMYDYEYHGYYSNVTSPYDYNLTGYDMCQIIDEDATYVGFVAYWPQLFGKMVKPTSAITRTEILSSLCTVEKNQTWAALGSPITRDIIFGQRGWLSADMYPRGGGVFDDEPLVFKNGILQFVPSDFTFDTDTDTITFVSEPADTDYIAIEYKHQQPEGAGAENMGFWATEPSTPYVIGEWCFELGVQPYAQQYRAVSVYGLTDRHDADDEDMGAENTNVIDCEVQYLLNEVFNPFDLYSAVHKKDYRWVDIRNLTAATSYITLNLAGKGTLVQGDWNSYNSFAERVLVNGVLIDRYDYHLLRNYVEGIHAPYYELDYRNGNITFYHYVDTAYVLWTLSVGTRVKVLYSTIMEGPGRYEWIVVGRNARTIDSAAAAYITEAFDSIKNISVAVTGMDIREVDYGPNSPWVMAGADTGVRNDYNDSLGRPHLKDDWCTTWPIASSNMIFMAGPRANLGTEYMNEFLNVFFARSEYVVTNVGQSNKIMGLSCWNFNNYASGYGVISVYEDLNGTIGLVFWGYTADDFYYTCKWFWSYPAGITCPDGAIVYSGIQYLQHENRGVTDIILKITYPTADPTHPTVAVSSERLGTISEKTQHDP
jgi:hypothetical protein